MLSLVVTLLIIALIAGILGFGGIAGAAVGIAKIVFLVALVIIVFLVALAIFVISDDRLPRRVRQRIVTLSQPRSGRGTLPIVKDWAEADADAPASAFSTTNGAVDETGRRSRFSCCGTGQDQRIVDSVA